VAGSYGQEFRGIIIGSVTDVSGAAVSGAEVTAANIATNVRGTAISSADGTFTIPFVLPGEYRVTAEAAPDTFT
jgi:hypothetical protein